MLTGDELKQLKDVVQDVVSNELKTQLGTELKPIKENIIELKKFAKRTDKKLEQIHQDQLSESSQKQLI